jgi:hypothetical protein
MDVIFIFVGCLRSNEKEISHSRMSRRRRTRVRSWTRPWCRATSPRAWRRCCCRARCRCWTRLCAVSPASVQRANAVVTAPNNHFAVGPDSGVKISSVRHVEGAGWPPTVRVRIISPAGVQSICQRRVKSAPHDHFTASPDCRMRPTCLGGVGGVRSCPAIITRVVFSTGVQSGVAPRRSFHRQSRPPYETGALRVRWRWS